MKPLTLTISPEIGKVSAELITPDKPTAIMTLAHGAGAGMNHEFMVTLSEKLLEKNIATLRFNFPYMENKKGRPDLPAIAHKAIDAAVQKARELFPSLPVIVSGKSFGGRMSSQYLAAYPCTDVKGIVFFGFPLHQPKKPSIERAEHLKKLKLPMLFLQGSKDEFATYELIREVTASLPTATLFTIEGANHSFKAGKKEMMPLLVEETAEWIGKTIKGKSKTK